jgi:hypothetical protein
MKNKKKLHITDTPTSLHINLHSIKFRSFKFTFQCRFLLCEGQIGGNFTQKINSSKINNTASFPLKN